MWRRVPLCRLPARRPWPGFMYLSPEWAGLCCKVGVMTRTPSGGRARPCDAHSAPGCSVTCPRHRARRAGSTRTDQSFIYKKKKLKPVLNSSRSCSGPSRDENPVFGSHRIPQDPTGPPGAPPRALLPGHGPRLSAVCPYKAWKTILPGETRPDLGASGALSGLAGPQRKVWPEGGSRCPVLTCRRPGKGRRATLRPVPRRLLAWPVAGSIFQSCHSGPL